MVKGCWNAKIMTIPVHWREKKQMQIVGGALKYLQLAIFKVVLYSSYLQVFCLSLAALVSKVKPLGNI